MTLHTTDLPQAENPLNELEDLLDNSPAAPLDLFGDLNNLLANAMELQGGAAKAKAYRQALATGRFHSQEEYDMMDAYVRDWDTRREWLPKADVVMFDTEVCTHCGHSHSHFVGYFERQQHRQTTTERWLSSTNPDGRGSKLPKERKVDVRQVPVCIECCGKGGY